MRASGLRNGVRRVEDETDVGHGAEAVEALAKVLALGPEQRHVHGVRSVADKANLRAAVKKK